MQTTNGRRGRGGYNGYGQGQPFGNELNGTTYYAAQTGPPPATHFCIDVECVATGTGHNDRTPAQIAVVDQYEQVLMNQYVRPTVPITSYLTPLTGITVETLEEGVPLEAALQGLKAVLPPTAILVGQGLMQDVKWLGLREGVDYQSLIDLAGLYRVWNPTYNSFSVFSQDHVARVLLQWPHTVGSHNAATDALKSMALYNHYLGLKASPADLAHAQQALLAAPVQPSFAKVHSVWEGVCMGNRKACTCQQPHFMF